MFTLFWSRYREHILSLSRRNSQLVSHLRSNLTFFPRPWKQPLSILPLYICIYIHNIISKLQTNNNPFSHGPFVEPVLQNLLLFQANVPAEGGGTASWRERTVPSLLGERHHEHRSPGLVPDGVPRRGEHQERGRPGHLQQPQAPQHFPAQGLAPRGVL